MTLADLCSHIVDCAHKTAPIDESGGYFAVGTPAMRGNAINYDEARRIGHATFEAWTSRLLPKRGDLLLAREAPVGPVVRIPPDENVAPGQRTVLLRPNEDMVDSRFLYYYLASPARQEELLVSAAGSTVAHLNVADVRDFATPNVPSLREQRAIADVLSALDDKIAANDRIITAADELASATWERSTPAGRAAPLSSIAHFVNGGAFTKGASGTGRVVVRIAELNSGLSGSTVYSDADVAEDHLARPGDLLFAWSGSLTVARWFRPEAIVNQHIFKVVPKDGYPMWLVNQAVRTKLAEFTAIAADKATTMGHIQRRHLDQTVSIPDPDEIQRIDGLMGGLWNVALAAERESLRLTETRDELLPLLMSGKVRVRDAENIVGAVT